MSGTTGFSFGGTTAPASSFSFGVPSTTSATSTTTFGASTTPSIGGTSSTQSSTTPSFNFGSTAPTAFSTTPSTAAPSTTPAASTAPSFSFGTTPSTTAPSTSASSATTSTFSFGTTPSTTTTTTAAPSTAAPSSTPSGTSGTPAFTFGAGTTTTAPSTTAATTPSTTSFSFGTTSASTSTAAPSTSATTPSAATGTTSFSFGSSASTTSSSTGVTPATPSTPATSEAKKIDLTAVLKNKNLEDIINDWSTQLEDHVGTFTKQAHQVAEWDNKIIDNGAKIMKIYEHVNKVQVSQKELDQTLELIFTQQQELNGMLDSLEGELDKLMSAQGRQENPADIERERGYQLAEDLNRQLDQMGVTLRDLIKKINANQQQSADDDNPIYQIVQILNAHLNSLQWIDQSSTALQLKIAEVDKQLKASKLEHDKVSRMRKSNFE